ncbi:hypothetical protein G3O08_16420 [Cryomorpha ignava]|uniref:Uncharacterized protein n=2 Tax=Cryomorpha ignava TaxID=101383 RepID=A0A7K3WUB5_9FLAO|nr:hypothetical protein [Cryomorpha ignava]
MITNSVSVLVAQAPQLINYQAIARNSNTGVELSDQGVFVSLKILNGGPNGSITYQEDHTNIETNRFGLFFLSIGGGIPVSGTFANINWSNGDYWLQIDIDAGNGLETMSSMQFVSVPYALHAETVSNADDADADPENELVSAIEFNTGSGVFSLIQPGSTLTQDLSALINDADADPQNELVTSIAFNPENNVFSLVQPGSVLTQDLSALISDADADPENELVTSIEFDTENNIFSLVQPGSTLTQDLSALINDADADPENELVTDIDFNSANNTFTLTQQGGSLSENLSALINDADADPENEAITSVTLSGTNLIINEVSDFTVSLSQLVNDADADPENEKISLLELVNDTIFRIHEGDEVYEIDFGLLKRDMDWRISDDGQTISNFGTKVGIGTTSPASTLQINGSVGYKTTLLTNFLGSMTYTVTPTDNILVCTMAQSNSNSITLNMPDAITCRGRSITIRKTGTSPILASVTIEFGSDLLDFSNVDYNMNSTQRETVTFISLGMAGWTRVYTD